MSLSCTRVHCCAPTTEISATFDTNVFGALRVARAFANVLAASGGGTLVDIRSVLSRGSGAGAHSASKAALRSMTNTRHSRNPETRRRIGETIRAVIAPFTVDHGPRAESTSTR